VAWETWATIDRIAFEPGLPSSPGFFFFLMKLEGRIALVTGGGSGIGRAICSRFHREGATVFVNDVSAEKARATADELDVPPERVLAADVSRSAEVVAMFARLPGLDVLVNNAGIAEPDERWAELNRRGERRIDEVERTARVETHWDVTIGMDDETWRAMLAVHLDGTFFCTREALKRMAPGGRGAIVNLSSTAALAGLPEAPHYAAAKAGVLGFTRSVALEAASHGIRVNAIAPGFTETPMTSRISAKVRLSRTAAIPLGRFAQPSEIAAVALFLASDDASYVTGQCLSPNGGSFPG
jgi:3-oxoacyl-[acyl-carrier protein] reductase